MSAFMALPSLLALHLDAECQALVQDEGEGMRRVDGDAASGSGRCAS